MADNVQITKDGGSPTAGTVVASDEVGGVQYQYVKLDMGLDGASAPVTNSRPLTVHMDIMAAVLEQLKIMNFHLMLMTNTTVTGDEVN